VAAAKAFLLPRIGLVGISAAFAQIGTYGPICGGLESINWCQQLGTGLASGMAVDSSGNTYVASGSTVTALDPNGSAIYTAPFSSPVAFVAPGANGILWVVAGSYGGTVYQVDSHGNESALSYSLNGIAVHAVASDSAGNLYLDEVPLDQFNHSIVKLTASGAVAGTFSLSTYGSVTAITADASGAVYVGGVPASTFQATAGAYQTAVPNSAYGVGEAYVLKIAAALDRVVYATLIYQGQAVASVTSPSAVAVDGLGNAYIGGYFWNSPDAPAFPATQIALPIDDESGSAYILKLNPQGAAPVWCVGLGSGSLDGLAVLPDGQVRALMEVPITVPGTMGEEAMFTIAADGSAIDSSGFLGGITNPNFPPIGFLATPPGGSAPARMLVAVNSGQIPVIFNDQAATPVVLDFMDPPPAADLSLSLYLVAPVVIDNDTVDVIATVYNNGPADAEGIQLFATLGDSTPALECFPGGIAICNTGGALIPTLPAGAAMSVEFIYIASCNGGPACSQSVEGRLFSMTSDPNLSNNFATMPLTFTAGFDARFYPPHPEVFYYRSDAPMFYGYYPVLNGPPSSVVPPTADPSLTIWVPIQTYQGNVWYFDSWSDGNRDNPRTIDASQGIPSSLAGLSLNTAFPIGVDPGSLDLVALPGATPLPQSVTLYPVSGTGDWTIGIPAAPWLTLSAVTNADGTETVTGAADLTGLAPGYYTTTFPATLAVSGLPDASMDVTASLRVMATAPAISPGGVVNSASYQGGPISPFEIVDIYGTGLGPPQLVTAMVPQAGPLPTVLAGTSVTIGQAPARLLYVQDNVIAAMAIDGSYGMPLPVTVTLGGTEAASLTMPAVPNGPNVNGTVFTPALFSLDASGSGNLAAVNADGSVNSPSNPAKRGSMVLLYGTGSYEGNPGWGCDPDAFGTLLLQSTPPVEAFVGGKPAYVLYSGSVPGFTCSAQQFNVIIPADAATGPAVPVQLGMAFSDESPLEPYTWYTSQPGTTLAIQ
jgi:uncharacterized protein (TIGR03437 family)